MARGSAAWQLACQPMQPAQLCPELFQHQFQRPYRFMKAVAHFFADLAESPLLACQFTFQKFAPSYYLPADHFSLGLPRKNDPGEKRRSLSLRVPLVPP